MNIFVMLQPLFDMLNWLLPLLVLVIIKTPRFKGWFGEGGWIFGGERQAQWTQQIFRHHFRFQNPLWQNYKHLKALEALLSVPPEHIYSVIAFVVGSSFKTVMPDNVTQGVSCIRYIKSFQQPVFNEAQVSVMVKELGSGKRDSTLSKPFGARLKIAQKQVEKFDTTKPTLAQRKV